MYRILIIDADVEVGDASENAIFRIEHDAVFVQTLESGLSTLQTQPFRGDWVFIR